MTPDKPKILLGEFNHKKKQDFIQGHRWGRMFVYLPPKPYPGEPWAFDNGAYLHWRKGEQFNEDAYSRRLERATHAFPHPIFYVVPDIVAGGTQSLNFSEKWVTLMPRPRYLAIQDGMMYQDVLSVIGNYDGLFLGGTDAFKLTARDWCGLAHRNNKKFHYARAGTINKLQHAIRIGADSLDSSFPLWTKVRLLLFYDIWKNGHPNKAFEFMEAQK